jgi:hypothetical protein
MGGLGIGGLTTGGFSTDGLLMTIVPFFAVEGFLFFSDALAVFFVAIPHSLKSNLDLLD